MAQAGRPLLRVPARGRTRQRGGEGVLIGNCPPRPALFPPPALSHIAVMAPPPDKPIRPKKAKDPAHPTRAKAARPELPPIAPALADLLNPAINRGEAGVGSQTGRRAPESGLQPPADNSRDRRNDFAAAHKARASTPGG